MATSVEISNTNIRIWIHDKDMASLEQVLWEGEGFMLIKHSSGYPKIRKFLEAVPRLMNDVKELHFAAVVGDVDRVQDREFRQQVYMSKDLNGLTAFHKAVANGHRSMAEHLMEKTDRGCINVPDRQGRTALHYAASMANDDEHGMYGWLLQMGADGDQTDNNMKTAEYYIEKGSDIDMSHCNSVPDAPRVARDQAGTTGGLHPSSPLVKRKLPLGDLGTEANAGAGIGGSQASRFIKKPKNLSGASKQAVVASKTDKLIIASAGKAIKPEQVNKWVKNGEVAKLEHALLMGKGKLMVGKTSWNDETRKFIKSVPDKLVEIDAFHNAALDGELATVQEMLKANQKLLYARDPAGRSALHKAAKVGHQEIARFLISQNQQSVKMTDYNMRTVLHYAARCESRLMMTDIIDECVLNGADKFARDSLGNMPEYYMDHDFPQQPTRAIKGGGLAGSEGPDKSDDDDDPEVAEEIERAIGDKDFTKLVGYILDGEADRLKDKSSDDEEVQEFLSNVERFEDKISKIHKMASNGSLKDLQELLDRKKFALAKDRKTGVGILHKAVLNGHKDVVKFLAEAFPLTLAMDDLMGRTALHYAAALNDNGDMYKILEKYGADSAKEDLDGKSPSHYKANREEVTHGELLDYVHGKIVYDPDSGGLNGEELSED